MTPGAPVRAKKTLAARSRSTEHRADRDRPTRPRRLPHAKDPTVRCRRQARPTAALALSGLLAACASAPPQVPEPEKVLAAAEARLVGGEPAACRDQLGDLEPEAFPRRLRDRYDLLLANAHFALGDTWDAFEVAERFPDRHPHSELRPQIVELVYQIGRTQAASDAGFWFFWSDKRSARTVLEHLITRHPDSPRLAEALRLLGDLAFDDAQYSLAQERYRDLLRKRPDSEWAVYARFRFAMSIVAGCQGPDYDLDQMELATRELQAFLDGKPENPDFLATAKAAYTQLLAWQSERHLQVAGFYRTVGNRRGERHHLQIAGGERFFGTPANQQAIAELAALTAAEAPK